MFARTFLVVGIISLFHAAYSAVQLQVAKLTKGLKRLDRSYLRITAQEFTSLPLDILFQATFSLFLTMYGVLHIAGDFKEIRATVDLESKSWETLRNIPSFYTTNHRGKALSPDYDPSRSAAYTAAVLETAVTQ